MKSRYFCCWHPVSFVVLSALYLSINNNLAQAIEPVYVPEINLPTDPTRSPVNSTASRSETVLPNDSASSTILDSAPFYIKGIGNKCIDAGNPETRRPGQVLVLYDCNQSEAQRIDIDEIPNSGKVVLKASEYCIGPQGGEMIEGKIRLRIPGAKLELQSCIDGAQHQQYAIDGDSILNFAPGPLISPVTGPLVLDRLVFETDHGRTSSGTAVVLGTRNLDDSEFWSFTPVFKHSAFRSKPTSGFVTVTDEATLRSTLANARPGTVVELGSDIVLNQAMSGDIHISSGVTIRGGRRGIQPGFRIIYPTDFSVTKPALTVLGDDVRITGLTIVGPSRSRHPDQPNVDGIFVLGDISNTALSSRTIIDHNDLSGFTIAAIKIAGGHDIGSGESCRPRHHYRTLPARVHVVRNYLHDNQKQGEGYGVEVAAGAHALIEANTFNNNRHAIASSPDARNEYYAFDNLVMPTAPLQLGYVEINGSRIRIPGVSWYSHDFDVHGSGSGKSYDFDDGLEPPHSNGIAGKNFIISGNTFLGDNRENLDLRGTPCLGASFYGNVTRQDRDDAVTDRSAGNILINSGNQFKIAYPTLTLGSGDFDGDGTIDNFMATGAAWYYQPNGRLEWRFLKRTDVGLSQLNLRDIDGDGRTDASYSNSRYIFASWGANSDFQVIGELPQPPSEEPSPPRDNKPPRTPPGGGDRPPRQEQ